MKRLGTRKQREPRTLEDYSRGYRKLPGWLKRSDFLLLRGIDELQKRRDLSGDILEIGAFGGRSAILLGYLLHRDETLVVCDLFGEAAAKNLPSAVSPRRVFEENYLSWHSSLPTILQCSSLELPDRLPAGSFRLIHIDGSHAYDVVKADIQTARTLLAEGGIVVLDDYLNRKFPEVAAAVWEAVATKELMPLCLTGGKMYATWSSAPLDLSDISVWASKQGLSWSSTSILGRDVLKILDLHRFDELKKAKRAALSLKGKLH